MAPQLLDTDALWFKDHPDRQARIRLPIGDEAKGEFLSLGPHQYLRRRILIWKVPPNAALHPNHIMKIPYLQFSDETIRDEDATLLPIIHGVMMDAAKRHGMQI